MLLSAPIAFARAAAQTDSNGLTDANAIIFGNAGLNNFHRQMVKKGVDASQIQESYTNGASGTGTYLYPADMLFLKAIELNYTDTQPGNYRTAQQVDVANLATAYSFSWLRQNADTQNPQFDDRGDWYEIFPTPTTQNISQLIRIFYYLKPTQFTATSDTVSYPENMDETILGSYIAARYLYSLKDSGSLLAGDKQMAEYQKQVDDYIGTLNRGTQQPIQATTLQITGYEF